MFRFGRHHMTVNATVVGPNIAVTPSFPGCQPCEYSLESQTVRETGDVTDRALALVNALDATQQAQTVLGAQGIDLVLGPQQPMRTIPPEGIKASALNPAQQGLLVDLVRQYVGLLDEEDAVARMSEIQANLADTYFAWYGPTTAGSAADFRVQGPTLWIEFSPQGGGGGAGGLGLGGAATTNHVHAIYRDPTNEYGARWVAG
jgi:hypothetical protein